MGYPLLIPEISVKVEKVLASFNLEAQVSPAEFIKKTKGKKHRYSSVCSDRYGKKVIFYARLHRSPAEENKMKTEVLLAKKLAGKKVSFGYFPQYYRSGNEKDFEWIVREYFSVSPLESEKKIEKIRLRLKDKDYAEISKAALAMTEIPVSKLSFLRKFDIGRYFECGRLSLDLAKEGVLTTEEGEKIRKSLDKNKKLLEKENKYFCHGDFHIGNIIVDKGRVKIIDLENACVNNFAFDIAFLAARMWQDRAAREKTVKAYFNVLPSNKKKIFAVLFGIDTFFISYRGFKARPVEYTDFQNKKRQKYFGKLMKAAVEIV